MASRPERRRMLLRAGQPRAQVGPGPRNHSLRPRATRSAGYGDPMKKLLQDAILSRPHLCDGAMGTQLMLAGLEQGNCGEEWNVTHPERVLAIQRRYTQAGAECIITNTFGGSRIMLNRHSNGDRAVELNKAGVAIARESFNGREGYVLGDVGPFGALLEPCGEFTVAQVRSSFEEQAGALVQAGADAIII